MFIGHVEGPSDPSIVYYINPFNYLIGGLVSRVLWDVNVKCKESEYGIFDPPSGKTCGQVRPLRLIPMSKPA